MAFKKVPRTGLGDVPFVDGLVDVEFTPMTEEEKDSYGKHEYELMEKIMRTLTNIPADIESKQRFAGDLVAEMPNIIWDAGDETTLPYKKDHLILEATKTKEQLVKFRNLLTKTRGGIGCNFNATSIMSTQITQTCDLEDAILYFDRMLYNLFELKTRERKKGKHNVAGQMAGKYIFELYQQYFDKLPQGGKGRRPYGEEIQTNYDWLCTFLGDTYGIIISHDARSLAWIKRQDKKDPK